MSERFIHVTGCGVLVLVDRCVRACLIYCHQEIACFQPGAVKYMSRNGIPESQALCMFRFSRQSQFSRELV